MPQPSQIFAITIWQTPEASPVQRIASAAPDNPEPPDTCWLIPDQFGDGGYFKDWKVTSEDVSKMLITYHRVSAEQWKHGYSHVGGGERSGWIILNDGSCVQWMMKPGGLGWLRFASREMIYLAAKSPPPGP